MVVLTLHFDEGHLAAEEFQGGEHLEALDEGHVGVGIAVEQQQGRVDLVGIEERRLIDEELAVAPGITVGHRHLAVVIAPVAFSPVTGVVGDARMTDGGSEDVGLRLQVHRHETAVGGSHAADVAGIDEGVGLTDLPRALDDVVGRAAASRVHVARGPLLAEARGSTGLEDIGHVAQRVPVLRTVGRLGVAAGG